MGFYSLSPVDRANLIKKIEKEIVEDLQTEKSTYFYKYSSDEDTYIRKAAYQSIGRIYFKQKKLQSIIVDTLMKLFEDESEKVRQTVVNALGEIGKKDADKVLPLFENALFDNHHSVRNAVIGSLKKMGEVNPQPVLTFSKKFLHHPDPEVRRQAIHGIELRGRTHPEEVLPLLEEMQNEQNRKVKNMVIHVIGQISYKEGCLEKVINALKKWRNTEIVQKAIIEILETHRSYEKFSAKTLTEAKKYIDKEYTST